MRTSSVEPDPKGHAQTTLKAEDRPFLNGLLPLFHRTTYHHIRAGGQIFLSRSLIAAQIMDAAELIANDMATSPMTTAIE